MSHFDFATYVVIFQLSGCNHSFCPGITRVLLFSASIIFYYVFISCLYHISFSYYLMLCSIFTLSTNIDLVNY